MAIKNSMYTHVNVFNKRQATGHALKKNIISYNLYFTETRDQLTEHLTETDRS